MLLLLLGVERALLGGLGLLHRLDLLARLRRLLLRVLEGGVDVAELRAGLSQIGLDSPSPQALAVVGRYSPHGAAIAVTLGRGTTACAAVSRAPSVEGNTWAPCARY